MAKVCICGMTPATAGRYVVVRQELDIIIARVNKAGLWLSEFEKMPPGYLSKNLTRMGRLITNGMAHIQDYLENEFASVEKIRAETDHLTNLND